MSRRANKPVKLSVTRNVVLMQVTFPFISQYECDSGSQRSSPPSTSQNPCASLLTIRSKVECSCDHYAARPFGKGECQFPPERGPRTFHRFTTQSLSDTKRHAPNKVSIKILDYRSARQSRTDSSGIATYP